MFGMFRLAGLSAVLAAAFVIATTERPTSYQVDLRPTLIVAFDDDQ